MRGLSRRDQILVGFLAVVTIVCFVYAGKIGVSISKASAFQRAAGKMNTLIVSVCSLRPDILSEYGRRGPEIMPNLEKFFRQSNLIFSNMFNGVPWISFVAFFERYFPEFQIKGVVPPGPFTEFPFVRIPPVKSRQQVEFRDTNDPNWEKDYKESLAWVKSSLPLYPNRTFVLVVHVKYMHYPLIDYFNADSEWDFYLSDGEKALIKEYLAHPEIYYKKLPFLLMLTSDPLYALAHPHIQAQNPQRDTVSRNKLLGLVSNERYLQEWKSSANFATDLLILKKIYNANARYMDSHITGPLMNLFGNKQLQDNTSVIFTGDHGEAHMDHDHLTHATSPFDDALAIPAAIYIPGGSGGPKRIKEQMHIHSLADFTREMAEHRVPVDKAATRVSEFFEDVFIMRDCANSVHALRYKNKYKYIIEAASGRRSLYDLESDPGEINDISELSPDIVAKMEGLYWANLHRFKMTSAFRCAPWDSSEETDVSF